MTPRLSVIIPTCSRPHLLERAIHSALNAAADNEVEVVVVPNGADTAWRTIAERCRSDARIHWYPMPVAHASAARNAGLAHARGTYVRFLDDDDYLFPAAAGQIDLIESSHADVCSAPLQVISANGRAGTTYALPTAADFTTSALLSIAISGLTQGSVFRRTAVADTRWREDVALYDDYLWLLDLAGDKELRWRQSRPPVGAYVQHDGSRLSRLRRSASNSRPLVAAIVALHAQLRASERLTAERQDAISAALLTHAHSAFPADPGFLGTAIRIAHAIAPDALPLQAIFVEHPWLARNLLATEWALLAPRLLSRGWRRALWTVRAWSSRAHA
ncbi:MAG TPA: glycosyltransferase [Rhodanobacteraceae bacterium]|nr:glycosyltransferase [Rhodanobacteraceae bacterium]